MPGHALPPLTDPGYLSMFQLSSFEKSVIPQFALSTASPAVPKSHDPTLYSLLSSPLYAARPPTRHLTMIKKILVCLFAVASATTTISVVTAETEAKGGKVRGDLVMDGIDIALNIIPLIGGLFKKKEYRQVACWVSTPSCFRDAAALMQNQVFQGRDGYSIESSGPKGVWVCYWRVRMGVSCGQLAASGKCGDGKKLEIFNCQTTGKVHC